MVSFKLLSRAHNIFTLSELEAAHPQTGGCGGHLETNTDGSEVEEGSPSFRTNFSEGSAKTRQFSNIMNFTQGHDLLNLSLPF